MKKPRQSWSVIIFCYNEKDSVRQVNEAVQKVLRRISSRRNEIIIVDDGSRDGSVEVIRGIAQKHKNVRAIYHPVNRGIGEALRSGYAAARYENVCAVPADGQFDSQELLLSPVVEEKTFVSFFRKKQAGYSLFRKLVSLGNRVFNRLFLGIHLSDVNWVKVYKNKELAQLDLRLHSSLIESEICAKLARRGNEAITLPSVYHQRQGGKARGASPKILWKALTESCKLLWAVWAYSVRG